MIPVHAQRLLLLSLLLLAMSGCSLPDSGGASEVHVTLTEFAIEASSRIFAPGVPYHLVITNRGKVNHELRIAPPGVQGGLQEIAWMEEMTLQPGTAHTIDVTFPQSARGTDFEFACHLPAHYEFGMHLAIMVR